MMDFAPDRAGHPLDILLARHARRLYNGLFLEAFSTGRWDLRIPPFTRLKGRRDGLIGSLDLVGVNYYSRLHVRFPAATRILADFAYRDRLPPRRPAQGGGKGRQPVAAPAPAAPRAARP